MQKIIEIEIINWEKYNPRSDRKNHTWFRLENTIASEPKFYGLTAAQKFIAICILAEASKGKGRAKIVTDWFCDLLKVKSSDISTVIDQLISTGVVTVTDRSPPATNLNHNFQDCLTTYVRTDERNERTNISSEHSDERFRAIPCFISLESIFLERKVTDVVQGRWFEAFPDSPWVIEQIRTALAWEASNPLKKKKNFAAFMTRWLSRGWDQRRVIATVAKQERPISKISTVVSETLSPEVAAKNAENVRNILKTMGRTKNTSIEIGESDAT